MFATDNLKECPTCQKSGYVNETYVLSSVMETEKKKLQKTIKSIEYDKNYYKEKCERNQFWNDNSWIIGLVLFVILAIGVAFAISNHTFQPDPPITVGDKIKRCSEKSGKVRCICMSGYVTELPKEGQADYVLLVNRCYAD